MASRNIQIDSILNTFLSFSNQKLLMDKMQSSDPKKEEDFMLMTGASYHTLYKSADLLDEINIRLWENKKTIKEKSLHLIYLDLHLLVLFLVKYIEGKLKKRVIPDKRFCIQTKSTYPT